MHIVRRRLTPQAWTLVIALLWASAVSCDRPPEAPTRVATAAPTATVTLAPSQIPSPSPVPQATAVPSLTPLPTAAPSLTPIPTAVPSLAPSLAPQTTTATVVATEEPDVRQCVLARARHYATTPTRYRPGSTGPTSFDCTGLVYRVFADCSANNLIGTLGEQMVRDYYDWFAARGLADAVAPREGDLIIYGLDFTHVAIYVGNGRAISALSDGVREHDALRLGSGTPGEIMPVKAYLHIQAK